MSAMLEFRMDGEVEALRRLLHATAKQPGGDPARRRAVAQRADCSPDNLYQVARGIPLKSGRPRMLGRDVQEKLDAAYPGWRGPPATGGGFEAGPAKWTISALEEPLSQEPDLERILSAIAAAIRKIPRLRRGPLKDQLALLVDAPDSAEVLEGLLSALAEARRPSENERVIAGPQQSGRERRNPHHQISTQDGLRAAVDPTLKQRHDDQKENVPTHAKPHKQ